MFKMEMLFLTPLLALAITGCGDVTVNQPARRVIIEEKKETPVIIEKTTVKEPVVIEKTVVEKPVIIEKTTVEKPVIVIDKH